MFCQGHFTVNNMDKRSKLEELTVNDLYRIVRGAIAKSPLGLSHKQIAFLLNQDKTTVYKWERPKSQKGNEIGMANLVRLSYILQDANIGKIISQMFYRKNSKSSRR